MGRSGGNSSSNPLQTKATQQASKQAKPSKAKQSKAIGLGDQGNMLIVKESNKIINK